jgi:hypothetical protein
MTRLTGLAKFAEPGDLRDDDNGIGGYTIFVKGGVTGAGRSERLLVKLAAASGDAPGCE